LPDRLLIAPCVLILLRPLFRLRFDDLSLFVYDLSERAQLFR
jgi:hypothetical protein